MFGKILKPQQFGMAPDLSSMVCIGKDNGMTAIHIGIELHGLQGKHVHSYLAGFVKHEMQPWVVLPMGCMGSMVFESHGILSHDPAMRLSYATKCTVLARRHYPGQDAQALPARADAMLCCAGWSRPLATTNVTQPPELPGHTLHPEFAGHKLHKELPGHTHHTHLPGHRLHTHAVGNISR